MIQCIISDTVARFMSPDLCRIYFIKRHIKTKLDSKLETLLLNKLHSLEKYGNFCFVIIFIIFFLSCIYMFFRNISHNTLSSFRSNNAIVFFRRFSRAEIPLLAVDIRALILPVTDEL